MSDEMKLAIIGLDTSHSVRFPEHLQSPDISESLKVTGMRAVTCLRFLTPFTDEDVLAERTEKLESWGVKVTEDFDEAVADVDALLLELNDPTLHLEYFERCAELGKPIFLDKPLADTAANGERIIEIAKKKGVRFFTSSSLRFADGLRTACRSVGTPESAFIYGPLGKALAGSSIIWYGVHSFEMLERAMGTGAKQVTTVKDAQGVVTVVEYSDGRRGVVALTDGDHHYGGLIRSGDAVASYDTTPPYEELLKQVTAFLKEGVQPVPIEDSLEVMKLLDAAERSYQSGKPVSL